jgi:lysophospholipase
MESRSIERREHPAGAAFSTWRAADGWLHRRFDWPQPRSDARGTLLFASGRGDFIEKYLEPMAHWQSGGWAVTGFDWRGQGGSRGSIEGGHLDSLDVLVEDLAGLIAELRDGPKPHVAIGHSMGGHLLLRALAERRVELDAAVLVAPMLAINSAPLPPVAASWTAATMSALGGRRQPAWQQRATPQGAGSSARPSSPPAASGMRTSSGGGSASPASTSARRAGAGSMRRIAPARR